MCSARVNLEALDLLNATDVAYCTIDYHAVMTLGVNRGAQVVANDGAVLDFAEQIHDQYISRLQNIDDPGVLVADSAFLLSVRLNNGINIDAPWHEDCGDGSPYHSLSWVKDLPVTFKLVAKSGDC